MKKCGNKGGEGEKRSLSIPSHLPQKNFSPPQQPINKSLPSPPYHDPHYPGNCNKVKSSYGWIRERDCYYAEKIGYKWFALNKPQIDFGGCMFTHILCRSGYLTHVLEPDTRVPNFTTRAEDALRLALALGCEEAAYVKQFLADADARCA